ncbi:hypothetical protein [Brevibacillus brevis]|uniref:hypothetical protein n=1 Tax=Brevibacillus brevis TaxID=1393 RepID=UPI001901A240|nr:hypothetical protein [Brevibacillus brevis]
MTYHTLKDVGERGIPLSLDFGERGQVLCTGPEWQMQDGPGWESMKFDNGPRWEMKTTDPEWVAIKMDDGPGWEMQFTGPDWELNMDGGPGWNPMTLLH